MPLFARESPPCFVDICRSHIIFCSACLVCLPVLHAQRWPSVADKQLHKLVSLQGSLKVSSTRYVTLLAFSLSLHWFSAELIALTSSNVLLCKAWLLHITRQGMCIWSIQQGVQAQNRQVLRSGCQHRPGVIYYSLWHLVIPKKMQ